jgi:hypothetical protein
MRRFLKRWSEDIRLWILVYVCLTVLSAMLGCTLSIILMAYINI